MKKGHVLFVCRFNRTRSRIAASYFNKLEGNKNFIAKSAGLFKGNPVSLEDIKLAKKFGIDIRGKPQAISTKLLHWQNLVVIVADDVPTNIFDKYTKYYGMKLIVWKIKDTEFQSKKSDLVKEIIKRVTSLHRDLVSNLE